MDHLNFNHLYYFWSAARAGGVAAAARELRISQPTISGQIKSLEGALGQRLFERKGRGLALTEVGQLVFGYADEIFALGRELLGAVRSGAQGRGARLAVGVTDALPKLVTHAILAPALDVEPPPRVTVREGRLADLLAEISVHRLDLVLSDVPAPANLNLRVFHHELGSSELVFVARPSLSRRLRPRFPRSLDGAPMVLPSAGTAMRRNLEPWFERHGVRPRILAEVDDSALLKVLGAERDVVVVVCAAVVDRTAARYGLSQVGRAEGCVERFYAISPERRLKHGAVRAITDAARASLLEAEPGRADATKEPK